MEFDSIKIGDIPEELLVEIFKFIKIKDYRSLACVCKTWRNQINSNLLWQSKFKQHGYDLPTDTKNVLLNDLKKKFKHLFNDQWSNQNKYPSIELSNNNLTAKNPEKEGNWPSMRWRSLIGMKLVYNNKKIWHIRIDHIGGKYPGHIIAIGLVFDNEFNKGRFGMDLSGFGPSVSYFSYICMVTSVGFL
jgi:hypothetical protein